MIDVLLIYPRLGTFDTLVTDFPLSLIYAAAESVKRGYDVRVLDLRVVEGDWRAELDSYLRQGVRLVGVSVMTGRPLLNAREVSQHVRAASPETRIVWGGPHATMVENTIEEPFIDFMVRGYGSTPLAELLDALTGRREGWDGIPGLSYKPAKGGPVHIPRPAEFETIPFRQIPYHLIDVHHPRYVRSYNKKKMFPIFTSVGCPYKCNFCMSPAMYEDIAGAKWRSFEEDEILAHIEYIVETFGARHILFLDDTSFPSIKRMRSLFEGIIARGLDITMEFRGARINELDKMDDDFLNLMVRAGTRVLMVGVESGSDRILAKFQKGITREQVLRVNRKLAHYPQIVCMYNMLYGAPGETYEDLVATKDLVLQILKDNPAAYVGSGGDWKPIPGAKLVEIAQQELGYVPPKTFDEWIQIDSSDAEEKIRHPWYTDRIDNMIRILQVCSLIIDDKIVKESKGNWNPVFVVIRILARLYKPVGMFRLRFNVYSLPLEYNLLRMAAKVVHALS